MKLVILDAQTLGADIDLSIFDKFGEVQSFPTTSSDEVVSHIANAQIILTNKVVIDKKTMSTCKDIKLICITATGMNNVDLEYAKQQGIEVKNVAGYSTNSVAQTTFTLLLSLMCQTKYYNEYVKSKAWSKSLIFTHIDRAYFEIKGKKWGIIGLGNIGKCVAKIADAFGANVSYYSTSGQNNDAGYTKMPLDELLGECDIISIHAPLNEKTENLIAKEQLALMKKGSILLNMGRGGIVQESDLADAIDSRGILAGLDVTKCEPIEEDNKLLSVQNKDNLIITPHIAWASKEARATLVLMVAKNIEEFLKDFKK